MTPTEKKEAVRQAIVKAVPGILDLNFGCYVKSKYHPDIDVIIEKPLPGRDVSTVFANIPQKYLEIIGRPQFKVLLLCH